MPQLKEGGMLDDLGATPDEVAMNLRTKGIRGYRFTVRFLNPIVRYAQLRMSDYTMHVDVLTGTTLRIISENGSQEEIALSPPIMEFLEAFNRGKYPDLESDE